MINRRELMIGGAAMAALPLLPPVAMASPPLRSRIFSFANGPNGETAYLLQSIMPPTENGSFRIVKHYTRDGIYLGDNVGQMERCYIANCPVNVIDKTLYDDTRFDRGFRDNIEYYVPDSLFHITRACNDVARATCRGKANNLIAHPHTVKFLQKWNWAFSYMANMYEDKDMDPNWVFVFFRGNSPYDAPGAIFSNGLVALNRTFREDSPFDYGRRVSFKQDYQVNS